MRTITSKMRGADFAVKMVNMRSWLDQHMFEPAKFRHHQDGEIIIVSVDFERDDQAEAFKSRFDGEEIGADFPLQNEIKPASRARKQI